MRFTFSHLHRKIYIKSWGIRGEDISALETVNLLIKFPNKWVDFESKKSVKVIQRNTLKKYS